MMQTVPPSSSTVQQWVALLTPIALSVLTVVNVWAAKRAETRGQKMQVANELVAQRADEVKKTLAETTKKSDAKLGEIHTLVNSERGVLLEMYASAMEVIAKQAPSKEATDAAKVARAMVDDHKRKQANVDAAKGDADGGR